MRSFWKVLSLGWAALVLAGTVAALIGWIAGSVAERGWTPQGPCSVSVPRHDMTATAVGAGARDACNQWLNDEDWQGRRGKASAGSSDSVVCEYGRDGLDVTVRDSGDHDYGNSLCDGLQCWAEDESRQMPDLPGSTAESLASPCPTDPSASRQIPMRPPAAA